MLLYVFNFAQREKNIADMFLWYRIYAVDMLPSSSIICSSIQLKNQHLSNILLADLNKKHFQFWKKQTDFIMAAGFVMPLDVCNQCTELFEHLQLAWTGVIYFGTE